MSAVLLRSYITRKDVIKQGTAESLTSVMATGSTIAFGSFAVRVPAFAAVFDAILAIPGNPYRQIGAEPRVVPRNPEMKTPNR